MEAETAGVKVHVEDPKLLHSFTAEQIISYAF